MSTASSTNSTTRSDSSSLFSFSSLPGKAYLFAVLNWGLGHASRSIPIIRELISDGKQVSIASDGEALTLLKKEFPQLDFIELPSYNVRYGKNIWSIVFGNSLNVLMAIIRENRKLKRLLRHEHYDGIISDSRFGFYSNTVDSYIISHQLSIPIRNSTLNALVNWINAFFLNKFKFVLIPDDPNINLSGKMSENKRVKTKRFIGIVSRLQKTERTHDYDLAIILSGPEPARTDLEGKLISRYRDTNKKIVLVRGTNRPSRHSIPSNWKTLHLASSHEINEILLSSRQVLSRSGYTSIMDYYSLGIPALLIPTPGQAEQEYLAEFLNGTFGFSCASVIHF